MFSRNLPDPEYLAFPFQVTERGPRTCRREAHLRDLIIQTLFTTPPERWFRPSFGGGLEELVFEPNSLALGELVKQRIAASLRSVLEGEVDPRTLDVNVETTEERLNISIKYTLATINQEQHQRFSIDRGGFRA